MNNITPPLEPLSQTWLTAVATDCGLTCERFSTVFDFAERVQRASNLARDAWWQQHVQALRVDAERYRWLRAQHEWHEMNRTQDAMWTCSMPAVEVDAAIDAARTKEQT